MFDLRAAVRKLPALGLAILIGGQMVFMAGCGAGASSPALTSSPAEEKPGPAVRLVFTTQPVGAIAGSAFTTQPVVAVQDAEGNIVTDYLGLVVLAITPGSGAPGAHLLGGTKVGVVNGMVTFRGLSIDKASAGYTLTATSGTLAPATSAPFTITPGAPFKLAFTTQPASGVAGAPLPVQPEVAVQDLYGNTVTSYQGSVTISATVAYVDYSNQDPSQPSVQTFPVALSGTTTVPVVNGVARFTNISASFAIPNYNLRASSGSLAPATSASFTISPAAPVKLVITVQPAGAEAGAPFATQPKVAVEDSYGNVVSSSRASITLSITPGSGTPGAVLSGTTTLVADDGLGGLAVFTDLSIDRAGEGYTLTATSRGLAPATSEAFDVAAP